MMSRRHAWIVVACAWAFSAAGAGAQSGSDAETWATQLAYDHSLRCFYANLYVAGLSQERGDSAKAATFEASAQRSFNMAHKAGQRLGFSSARMDGDFDTAEARELPKLVHDREYFARTAADCKQLGLM